ncbi:MAG TPA: AAA family ATPase [Thermoplasmata archaeon]|nr:AAA family ATPase [Thermoplasmata archaeon]
MADIEKADNKTYAEFKRLERENQILIQQVYRATSEKKYYENELRRYQNEIRLLKKRISELRSPPLLISIVEERPAKDKLIVKHPGGPQFMVKVPEEFHNTRIPIGTRVALNKDSLALVSILSYPKSSSVMGAEVIERPDVTFNDIGGLVEEKRLIREAVELPLKKPHLFERIGIEPPNGILLIGKPGTGKTLLAKAVANSTKATFLHMVASELVQKFIGEGARLVRELFALARDKEPSIIFIDELDAIGARRLDIGTTGDREVQRTLMQFLAEMDGFTPRGKVKVIAATNRADILDEALLRPGRFDRIIEINPPSKEDMVEIYQIHTRKMPLAEDVNLETLAEHSQGFNGADIKNVCVEAGMNAIRKERKVVTREDFELALSKVRKEQETENPVMYW